MGTEETKEETEKREINEIKAFMNDSPSFTYNGVDEKCIRYLKPKQGSAKYNIWAFNRAGFFDPKSGIIIGLYSLLGLVASQNNEKEAKLLHDLFIKRDKTFKGVKGAEKLTEPEKDLLIRSFEFLEAALPQSEIKNLFKNNWGKIVGLCVAGATVGGALGFAYGGAAFIAEGILAGTGVGLAVVGLSLLGYGVYKMITKKKASDVQMDSCIELFNKLASFFENDGSTYQIEQKLRYLEQNNLFIIRIDYGNLGSKRYATTFEYKNIPGLQYCDLLTKGYDEKSEIRWRYYKNVFYLFGEFFKSFGLETRDGGLKIDVKKSMDTFSKSYKELEDKMLILKNKAKDKSLIF